MNETDKLYRRALRLEYFTIAYNIIEAVASIVAGGFAGSIALIGFGLDSIVESLSGMVLLWRLHHHGRISAEEEEKIEARAVRFVGITFLLRAPTCYMNRCTKLSPAKCLRCLCRES
jgi:hypothetical protein